MGVNQVKTRGVLRSHLFYKTKLINRLWNIYLLVVIVELIGLSLPSRVTLI